MGSDSKSSSSTKHTTNNRAYDQSVTNGEGLQILDSVIYDHSDKVVSKAMEEHRATFARLMQKDEFALSSLLGLAKDVMKLVETGKAQLDGFAREQLRTAIKMMEEQRKIGVKNIELVEDVADDSFKLANNALDIVADVKTGDFQSTMTKVSSLLMIFGLGALYIVTKNK